MDPGGGLGLRVEKEGSVLFRCGADACYIGITRHVFVGASLGGGRAFGRHGNGVYGNGVYEGAARVKRRGHDIYREKLVSSRAYWLVKESNTTGRREDSLSLSPLKHAPQPTIHPTSKPATKDAQQHHCSVQSLVDGHAMDVFICFLARVGGT